MCKFHINPQLFYIIYIYFYMSYVLHAYAFYIVFNIHVIY